MYKIFSGKCRPTVYIVNTEIVKFFQSYIKLYVCQFSVGNI